MKKFFILGFLFFAFAIFCFCYGTFKGEVQVGVVFIFPFLVGSGIFSLFGTIFLIVAIFCFALAFISRANNFENLVRKEKYTLQEMSLPKQGPDVDGIVLIGPFPVIFTTKKSHILYLCLLAFALVIGILIMILFLAIFL